MICYMRCVNAFFIDITNIFVNMTDFSCHFNQKDTLRIPNECLCYFNIIFLLCKYLLNNMFISQIYIHEIIKRNGTSINPIKIVPTLLKFTYQITCHLLLFYAILNGIS